MKFALPVVVLSFALAAHAQEESVAVVAAVVPSAEANDTKTKPTDEKQQTRAETTANTETMANANATAKSENAGNAMPKAVSQPNASAEEPNSEKMVEKSTETKPEGHEAFFVSQEPGKMSGQSFAGSVDDRKALPQSVYNWILNNLGATKDCGKWIEKYCSEDFNLVSYEKIKDSNQFLVLQHQFSLKQERMVFYVLSQHGELLQMQLSRDERVLIKPTSTIVE